MKIPQTTRKLGLCAAVAACAIVLVGVAAPRAARALTVVGSTPVISSDFIQTADGPIKGKISEGVRQFLGIPYAAPPVGNLRWRPPQPPAHWHNTKKTVVYGDTCAQSDTLGVFAAKSQSEDCLYLNVFAPKNTNGDAALPVMVWIHGGGLFDGESNDYNGSKLVKQGNVIVVTINYRLNVFGFLALPGLDNEGHAFANYGLMDQQFALKWVKKNISVFGGNPSNVTIFGESAGGHSVLANLISPTAKGLFDRGIVESGTASSVDLITAEAHGKAFAKAVGCNSNTPSQTVACLRSLSVKEIQSMASRFNNDASITVDGTTITKPFNAAIKSGDFNHVPVIDGTNRNEARFFVGLAELNTGKTITADRYANAVRNGIGIFSGYGADTPQILDQYPLSQYSSPSLAASAVNTDAFFVCPHLRDDKLISSQDVPTYVYQFADRTAPSYAPLASFPYGAYHTSEIQYLFPLYHGGQGTPRSLNQTQEGLSNDMVRYWTMFAQSGNPNSSTAPHWPRYKTGKYQSLQLPQPKTKNITALRAEHHCDFWDKLQQQ